MLDPGELLLGQAEAAMAAPEDGGGEDGTAPGAVAGGLTQPLLAGEGSSSPPLPQQHKRRQDQPA